MLVKCIVALLLVSCMQEAKDFHTASASDPLPDSNKVDEGADYRLPQNVIPSYYNITLTPDFENFTFDGEVIIKISATPATDVIKLHYNVMNISETKVTATNDEEVKIISECYSEETNVYNITLDSKLEEGKEYVLYIKYRGYLLSDMAGFYRSSYNTSKGEQRWLASTQFEPTGARRAFPCFDEPQLKAKFQVNIIRDDTRRSISNAPLKETIELDKEKKLYKDVFEETSPMSTYLVAFIVSDFEKKEINDTENDRIYSVWAQPELVKDAEFSLNLSVKVIKYMEDFTGIQFELPKMEQAAIPDFAAGAMENWGLVTYRERYVLANSGKASVTNQKMVGTVVTHELAHQWFGDLVSPKWWKYTWLNEGFATYFESFGLHAIMPDWRLNEQFVVDIYQNALAVDAVNTSHPITTDVLTPAEIEGNFDNIEYDKAGSVIRSAEHFLTTKTFQEALKKYLASKKHSVAEAEDLFNAFDALEGSLNTTEIFKSWTEKAGYPVINVTANQKTRKYHISQSRFLISGTATTEDLWWVPITYTRKSELNFKDTKPKMWLENLKEDDIMDIDVDDGQWIILNIQATGFYRVLYDEANYKSLIAYLKSQDFEKIYPINRAQLIDDTLNLARAGLLDYTVALDLTEYLIKETDYIPWVSFFNGISFLKNRFIGTNLYGNFKVYVHTLIKGLYEEYSNHTVPADDTQTNRLNRINILSWACELDYKTCIKDAFAELELMMKNSDADIHPDLRSVVYCYGIREGNEKHWNFMWERYMTVLDAEEKNVILNALACSKDTKILQSLLQSSIEDDSGIRLQDSAAVFSAVYRKPEGLAVALDFLDSNFDQIKQYCLAMNGLPKIISGIASQISTAEQRKKFATFFNKHVDDLGGVRSAAENALHTIEHNLEWLSTYRETFIQWFEEHYPTSPPTSTSTMPTSTDAATSLAISLPLVMGLVFSITFLSG